MIPLENLSGQSAVECCPQYHQGTCQDKVHWSVVLSTIREPVKTNCSGLWSLIPLENLSGKSAVECGPRYHQGTCHDNVQWSTVLSNIREPVRTLCGGVWSSIPLRNLSGQYAMKSGPQYHQGTCQGTCQDNVQWTVVFDTIREPVKTNCSLVWSSIPTGNLSGQGASAVWSVTVSGYPATLCSLPCQKV